MTAMTTQKTHFADDTKNHTMEVLLDNGVFRHLVFSNNGSMYYRFAVTTWPGNVCVSGDMDTFVFARTHDMFELVRGGTQLSYLAEKCTAGIARKYSSRKAREVVAELAEELDVSAMEGVDFESEAAVREALLEVWSDSWEMDLTDYVYHFRWVAEALAHAVKEYDKYKESVVP